MVFFFFFFFFPSFVCKPPLSTACAVSSVLFLRGVFPDNAFIDGDICGVPVRNLNPDSDLEEVKLFARFVDEGILKTVRLNMLSSAELLVLAPKGERVLERYCFHFSETGEMSVLSDNNNKDKEDAPLSSTKTRECKDSVRIMLRKLLVTTDALGPLVDGCQLAIRLTYKDFVPPEFEPKFFQTGGQALDFGGGVKAPLDLNLGMVESTGYAMDFLFQANPEQLRQDSDEHSSPKYVSSPAGTEPQQKKNKK